MHESNSTRLVNDRYYKPIRPYDEENWINKCQELCLSVLERGCWTTKIQHCVCLYSKLCLSVLEIVFVCTRNCLYSKLSVLEIVFVCTRNCLYSKLSVLEIVFCLYLKLCLSVLEIVFVCTRKSDVELPKFPLHFYHKIIYNDIYL